MSPTCLSQTGLTTNIRCTFLVSPFRDKCRAQRHFPCLITLTALQRGFLPVSTGKEKLEALAPNQIVLLETQVLSQRLCPGKLLQHHGLRFLDRADHCKVTISYLYQQVTISMELSY
jgi:hypothetical protein